MDAEEHPSVRPLRVTDALGKKFVDKTEKAHDRALALKKATNAPSSKKSPPGGFEDTPLPRAPPGYTLKFTFHRAINLPAADINSLSSDPYIRADLDGDIPRRHKNDPLPTFRTPTVRRNVNPVWDSEWIVANVPASGFRLECRLFDEDPADHDDGLGHAHIHVQSIDEAWEGIHEKSYEIKLRSVSKRAYFFRAITSACSPKRKFHGQLVVSVECLGKTSDDNGGQVYTVGPIYWFKHFSPLIGRFIKTKDISEDAKGKTTKYNFQAIEMQLAGPVPPMLYHRYVEFKPFVAGMFTDRSLRGRILNRALHHQHARIYNHDKTTLYGNFTSPCLALTQKFLDFTFYGRGGRVFTYILTLDGMFRFTETGKEFGIDMLSKHTMHSNVAIYTACAGEFFVRHYHRHDERPHHENSSSPVEMSQTLPENPAQQDSAEDDSTDPTKYELVIDNDSGTYRPNPKCLPLLREFFSSNFLGLHVTTLDCQADEELMNRLKEEKRQEKDKSKGQVMYTQRNNQSDSSLSSSDEEEMQRRAGVAPANKAGLFDSIPNKHGIKGRYKRWLEGEKDQGDGGKPKPDPVSNGVSAKEKSEHENGTHNDSDASTNGPYAQQHGNSPLA